ncbi:hypothetical protein KY285_022760 [Solanum tuberosum]|nr:hypothetical protein KY285_022760 [Solanum tuberosum]
MSYFYRAAAAFMMGDDMHRQSRSRFERGDFRLNGGAGIANPASRQIYLIVPADSTFKEEDVSNYFRLGARVRGGKGVKGDDGQIVGSWNIGILMRKSIQLLKILKRRGEVIVELKNDLAIRATLHSVDQYLNIKLQNTRIVDEDK